MSRYERLKVWVDTLNEGQLRKIALETVDYLVGTQDICFWEDTKNPYWDANGERLDGIEEEYEEDEF